MASGWMAGMAMAAGRLGGFSEELIRRIKDANEIVEVVSQFVTLRSAGQNLKGLCPFHAEKTPSFTVNPARQIFHCFGCGSGGDVISFLARQESLSFPEAVGRLADRAGIPLPQKADKRSTETDLLLSVHEAAHAFFRAALSSPQGQKARAYLSGRGVPEDAWSSFGLGFAPASWDALSEHLGRKGFSVEILAKAGLARLRPNAKGVYDSFRNRLIFPIVDLSGRVIAFGGRSLDESVPKYLNSPETPIFRKGDHLYGLFKARESARRKGATLLVEGYFDVIAAHETGFDNAAATLGTALTPRQAGQLARLAPGVVFVYDGDAAGLSAMRRSAGPLLQARLAVDVAVLPEGEDPDSLIRTRGAEDFGRMLGAAVPLLDFVLDRLIAEQKGVPAARIVEQMFPLWKDIATPIERGERIRRTAERLNIDERWIFDQWQTFSTKAPGAQALDGVRKPAARGAGVESPGNRVEESFLRILMHQPDWLARAKAEVAPDLLSDAAHREAYVALIDGTASDSAPVLTRLAIQEVPWDPAGVESEFEGCLRNFRQRRQRMAQRDLYRRIREAESAGETETLKRQLAEHMKVSKETSV